MQKQTVEQALDQMLDKVQKFTVSEFNSIAKNLFGKLIIKLDQTTFKVGRYILTHKNSEWCVTNELGDHKGDFSNKLIAFYYVFALLKDKFNLSDRLKLADENVVKYRAMHQLLSKRIQRCKPEDQFALNLFICKLSVCSDQLAEAEKILEQALAEGKYLNLIGKN